MNRALLLIVILLFSSPAFTEEPYEVPDEYMKKIMEQNTPAMEKYLEENPDIKKHYQKELEAAGLIEPEEQTGQTVEQPPPRAEVKTIEEKEKFTGSREEADEAYAKGDYETAMKHYKALAEEGDGKASLTVGIMYGDGLGIKKDKTEAFAWLKRSSDQGEKQRVH